VVHKVRVNGNEVSAERVIGDVIDRSPLIVDDMVTTGGTLEAAARVLHRYGSLRSCAFAVTHAVLVARATDRFASLPMRGMVVSDTLPVPPTPLPLEIVSMAPLLADAIGRLNRELSLESLRAHH
jgi:ribose-phosphate pyrophosphokinase